MNTEEIFANAVTLEADQRGRFLDQACGEDHERRTRIERLLAAHAAPDSLLELDGGESTSAAVSESIGQQIGPYKLLQKLGEGGMGEVYLAERLKPVKQRVALKIIKSGMDSKKFVARFEAERQALAMMDHPNIAKVFDAGTTTTGRPYFVMELVKGIPITKFCDDNKVAARARLELFLSVCHAVQHAHQKGIIHRDLKPSNVLVAMYDDRPVPKVIDFGLAKAANQQLTERTLFTEVGSILGTWEYMSPEQAVLNQLDVDTRTDVYSLGVILYELMTGVTPLDRDRLRSVHLQETLRIIQEEEPPRPSTRLSTQGPASGALAKYRSTGFQELGRFVRGDLDWITMKALEKDRKRRYESASRLADDVDHFLAGEAIEARPPTLAYRLSKTWQRHKWPISVATSAVVSLIAGTIVLSLLFVDRSQRASELAGTNASLIETSRSLEEQKLELLAQQRETNESRYAAIMQNAMTAYERNDMGHLSALVAKYADSDLRRWEWSFLDRLRTVERDPTIEASSGLRLAFSPTEDLVIAAHPADKVAFTVVRNSKVVKQFGSVLSGEWEFHYSHFSHDGRLFLHSSDDFTEVIIRDSQNFEEVARLTATNRITNAIFSADDREIYAAVRASGVDVYSRHEDGWTFKETWTDDSIKGPYRPMCLIGSTHLVVGIGATLAVWDVATGRRASEARNGHSDQIRDVAWASEIDSIVTAGEDRMICVWETPTSEDASITLLDKRGPFSAAVRCLAYDPMTNRLAAGLRDRQLKIWSLPGFNDSQTVRGTNGLYAIGFDRNGKLAYGGADGISTFDEDRESHIKRVRFDRVSGPPINRAWVHSLRFHPNNRQLIVRHKYEPYLSVVDVHNGSVRTISINESHDNIAALSKQFHGNSLLVATGAGELLLFDIETERSSQPIQIPSGMSPAAIEFSANYDSVIMGTSSGEILEFKLESAAANPPRVVGRLNSRVRQIIVTDQGEIVAGDSAGTVGVWKDHQEAIQLGPFEGDVVGLDAKAGRIAIGLFSASRPGGNLFFRDVDGDYQNLIGNSFSIMDLALIENGRTLLVVGADRELKFWDLELREPRMAIHDEEVMNCIAVSDDENTIAVGTREGTVILYQR